MRYDCTHEGPLEIHKIEIHQVDLATAAHRINRELYSKCRLSPSLSDQVLALALIVKAVEDEKGMLPQNENADANPDETPTAIPFPKNGGSESASAPGPNGTGCG